MKRTLVVALVGTMIVQTSCATNGTRPHDQGAVQHEASAKAEETAAAAHGAKYDPSALRISPGGWWGHCPGYSYGPAYGGHLGYGIGGYGVGCYPYWTSVWNPTEKHLAEAEARRDLAQRHRAASQTLRDAEARACQGIPAADRDTSPFVRSEDIERVEPLLEGPRGGHTVGARVVFRALPAMTAEWLQRLVNCHAARAAAIGFADPSLALDPMGMHAAAATVRSRGDGFAVDIRGDSGTAQEILRRACQVSGRCSVTDAGEWKEIVAP